METLILSEIYKYRNTFNDYPAMSNYCHLQDFLGQFYNFSEDEDGEDVYTEKENYDTLISKWVEGELEHLFDDDHPDYKENVSIVRDDIMTNSLPKIKKAMRKIQTALRDPDPTLQEVGHEYN